MADNKSSQLNDGFQEIPLQKGFEEVPLEQPGILNTLISKGKEYGSDVLKGANSLAGDIEAGIQQVPQGALLGGADEAYGAIRAGAEQIPKLLQGEPTDFKNKYRQHQQQAEKFYEQNKEQHPISANIGELGGALGTGILTSGYGLMSAAPSIAEGIAGGALLGGAQGALSSKATSDTDAGKEQIAKDTLSSGAMGGLLAGGIGLAGKAGGAVVGKIAPNMENHPWLRQIGKAFQFGKEGKDITSESQKLGGLVNTNTEAATDLMTRINTADETLGRAVGQSIQDATNDGVILSIARDLQDTAKNVGDYVTKVNPAFAQDPEVIKTFAKISNLNSDITPTEALTIRDSLQDVLDKLQGDNSTVANATRKMITSLKDNVVHTIKEQVPGYKAAADRFQEFRTLIPETLMSKGKPVEVTGIRSGTLGKPDLKLFEAAKEMYSGATKPGTSNEVAQQTFSKFSEGLKAFENAENVRQQLGEQVEPVMSKLGGETSEEILKGIKNKADEVAMLHQAGGQNPQEGMGTLAKSTFLGDLATTGRGKGIAYANKIGLAAKSLAPVGNFGKNMYNLPVEGLQEIGNVLKSNPATATLGNALHKGLENGNSAMKNAAIFSILQRKDARELLEGNSVE